MIKNQIKCRLKKSGKIYLLYSISKKLKDMNFKKKLAKYKYKNIFLKRVPVKYPGMNKEFFYALYVNTKKKRGKK